MTPLPIQFLQYPVAFILSGLNIPITALFSRSPSACSRVRISTTEPRLSSSVPSGKFRYSAPNYDTSASFLRVLSNSLFHQSPIAIGASAARTVASHNHHTTQSELLTPSLSNHSVWRKRGAPQKTRFFVQSPHLTVHITNLAASLHFMLIDFSDTISVRLRHLAL